MGTQIPQSEFEARIESVQREMQKQDLDGCLAFANEAEPQNCLYLADYPTYWEIGAVFVPAEGDPTVITGPEGISFAKTASIWPNLEPVHEFRESAHPDYALILPKTSIVDVLKTGGVTKRLGLIGFHVMRASLYQAITAGMPEVECLWVDDILNSIKAVKSENELKLQKAAFAVSDAGLQAAAAALKEGATENDVQVAAQIEMLKLGAGGTGFFVNAGPNSLCDFTGSSDYRLKRSEIIGLQIGCNFGGYSGSTCRPAVIGEVPADIRKFVDASRKATDILVAKAKAGTPARDVAQATVDSLTADGYGETFRWGPAHGTGIYECEAPFLETTSDYVLKENMTFNIDLYLRNETMGFRFEDGFRVTRDGGEVFNTIPRDLINV